MPAEPKPKIIISGTLDLNQRGRTVAPLFSSTLEDLGFEVVSCGEPNVIININHNWRCLRQYEGSKVFKVLIRLEPETVYPRQYSTDIESDYDLVLSPGMPASTGSEFIRWPYQYQENPLRPDPYLSNLSEVIATNMEKEIYSIESWSGRKILCSMIAANKVSPNDSGNYQLRRDYAESSEVEIYGELWKATLITKLRHRLGVLKFAALSRTQINFTAIFSDLLRTYPSVRGSIKDKHAVVSDSKYSLVIENSDTYISEKLIDCLISGSIPIYYGTSFNSTSLTEDLVIRYDGSPHNLVHFLDGLDTAFVEEKLAKIKNFISGEEILKWASRSVYESISIRITKEFGARR